MASFAPMLHLIATAVLAVSQPAPSLQPETRSPFDVPAPASLRRDEVLSWMARYVSSQGWTLAAYDREGVKLVSPGGVRLTSEGLAEAEVRTELFRPIEVSAGVARSGVARWNVDCAGGRLAVTRMTIYAGNNLQGQIATRTTDGPTWQDPVGSETDAIRAVCSAIGM